MIIYSFGLAHWLGPNLYGVIAANYSLTTLTSFLVNWGLDTWLLRQYSQRNDLPNISGQVLILKATLGCAWSFILWIIAPAIAPELFVRPILGIVILNTLLDSVMNVMYVALVGSHHIKTSSLIFVLARFFRLISAYFMILLGYKTLLSFVLTRIIVDFIFLIIAGLSTKQLISLRDNWIRHDIFIQALPYGWSELLNIIYSQADINLVSFISQNQELIGQYSIVIGLTNAIAGIMQSIHNVLLPIFTRLFIEKSRKFIPAVTLVIIGAIISGTLLWLGIVTMGYPIVHLLLGQRYDASATFFAALAPVFIIKFLSLSAVTLLITINYQKKRIVPQSIGVTLKVVLTILVFSRYQVIGIIFVYIFSELITLAGYLILLFKWYKKYGFAAV